MKRILTTIVLASIFPFFTTASVSADEHGKEERKYYEEQERETRKFYEEQEREARKYREEREREERKHYEEQEREAKKRYKERHKEKREHYKEWKHDEKGKHVRHKRHKYRYYPSSSVYYDEKKKVYFYLEGDNWGVSVNLPHGINLGHHDYVTIETDKDRPYDEYHEHREKYGRHK